MLTPLPENERQELRNSLNLTSISDLETHLRVAISLGTLPDDLTDVIIGNNDEHVQEYVVQTLFGSLKKDMIRGSRTTGSQQIPSRLVTALLLDASFDVFSITVEHLLPTFTHDQLVLSLRRILEMITNQKDSLAWVRSSMRYTLKTSTKGLLSELIYRGKDELIVDVIMWDKELTSRDWYQWVSFYNLDVLRNCPKTVQTLYNLCDIESQTHIAKGIIAIHPDVNIRKQALDQLLRISSKELIDKSINAYYSERAYRRKGASLSDLEKEVTKPNLLQLFASDPSDEIRLMLAKSTSDQKILFILSTDNNAIVAAVATTNLTKFRLRSERQYKYHQQKKCDLIPSV